MRLKLYVCGLQLILCVAVVCFSVFCLWLSTWCLYAWWSPGFTQLPWWFNILWLRKSTGSKRLDCTTACYHRSGGSAPNPQVNMAAWYLVFWWILLLSIFQCFRLSTSPVCFLDPSLLSMLTEWQVLYLLSLNRINTNISVTASEEVLMPPADTKATSSVFSTQLF